MGRTGKSLLQRVRERSFLARHHEHLLIREPLLAMEPFRSIQERAKTSGEDRLRAIALEFETAVQREAAVTLDLDVELRKLGSGAARVPRFFARFYTHQQGPMAGRPFVLEPFQERFVREFWRRRKDGTRLYTVGLLGLPKGNGKTPLAAGLGEYALVSELDAPEVYVIAGALDQAQIAQRFARNWAENGDIGDWVRTEGGLYCLQRGGFMEIQSSDGRLGHGVNPSAAIVDEWWLFELERHRESYVALEKALHKRQGRSWLLAISTAGFNIDSQLGEAYTAALRLPDVRVSKDGCFTEARDPESGFYMAWYGAPDGADVENPKILRACNPLSTVQPAELLRELRRPGCNENDWLRLHANKWTTARDAWLPYGTWPGLRSETPIPPGADIFVAADAALKHDTSALAWAARLEDGRIAIRCRVWSARAEAAHHVLVPGGRIDNSLLEDFIIHELAQHYRVREITFDPRYFETQAQRLSDHGFEVVELGQNTGQMASAYQHMYAAALAGDIAWDDTGDVFRRHAEAAAAELTERGWKVYKLKSSAPIDALVAAVMARERCSLDERVDMWMSFA